MITGLYVGIWRDAHAVTRHRSRNSCARQHRRLSRLLHARVISAPLSFSAPCLHFSLIRHESNSASYISRTSHVKGPTHPQARPRTRHPLPHSLKPCKSADLVFERLVSAITSNQMALRPTRSKCVSALEKRLGRSLSADETLRLAAYARAVRLRREQTRIYKPRCALRQPPRVCRRR